MSECPDFYTVTHHVAKKPHRCHECKGIIAPLDVYERTAGKWDGRFETFKVCGHCETARDWLLNETEWTEAFFIDDGIDFCFGELRQHLKDYGSDGDRLKAFRAYRFIVLMDRRRKAAKDKQ